MKFTMSLEELKEYSVNKFSLSKDGLAIEIGG